MKFVNVRELSTSATKILKEDIEAKGERVVITRRGKPIGLLVSFKDKVAVAEAMLQEAENLLKESKIKKQDVLDELESLRKRIYA